MDGVIVGFISVGLIATINLAISAFNYGKLSQSVMDLLRRMTIQEAKENDKPPCSFLIEVEKQHIALKGRVDAHLKTD